MKNLTFIFLLGIAITSNGQILNRTFEKANGSVNLLGVVTVERLKEAPFKEWYQESYSAYEVNDEVFESVDLPDSITIFMGTWCGDSRREVPRFIKMLESQKYDLDKLNIICLNTGFQNYKQAPDREERGMDIHRVPTFVFHDKEAKEIGRIVEEPVVSLEQDMKDVMEGKPYNTAYPLANAIIQEFRMHSLKEMKKRTSDLVKKYKGISEKEYELNTYAYVLWASFDLIKAEFVMELNTKMFPDSATPFSTLASFQQNLGNSKEVMKNVKKGLVIDPENKRLLSLKESLVE